MFHPSRAVLCSVLLAATVAGIPASAGNATVEGGLNSGDTVQVQAASGRLFAVGPDSLLHAFWPAAGAVQQFQLEKAAGGPIISGDTVFLRAASGLYVDVMGTQVAARWDDRGSAQQLVIEKTGGGRVMVNDTVFFKASTGNYLDVAFDDIVRARWPEMGAWQTFALLAAPSVAATAFSGNSTAPVARPEDALTAAVISSGDVVFLKGWNGFVLDVQPPSVMARWTLRGNWQALTIERFGGGQISSGDQVFLKAYTGQYLQVSNSSVLALWGSQSTQTALTISKPGGGPIRSGESVYFTAWTGLNLEVESDRMAARFSDFGTWQAFTIEREDPNAIRTGDSLSFLASTGKRLGLQGGALYARFADVGAWEALVLANDENVGPWMQAFTVQGGAGRVIYSGDAVQLNAYTKLLVDTDYDGVLLQARFTEAGAWQTFTISKVGGGAILPGDAVTLTSSEGNLITVYGSDVQAVSNQSVPEAVFIVERADLRGGCAAPCDRYTSLVFKPIACFILCGLIAYEFVSSFSGRKS